MGGGQTRGWKVAALLSLASAIACGGDASCWRSTAARSRDASTGDVTVHADGGGGGDATVNPDTGAGDSGPRDAGSDDSGRQGDASHDDGGTRDAADAAQDASSDAAPESGASTQDASDSSVFDASEGGVNDAVAPDASDASARDANLCGPGVTPGVPTYHRPDDSQCSQPAPPGDCQGMLGACGADAGSPASDSLCTAGDGGRCEFGGLVPICACTYDTCAQDTDCQPGNLCACHGSPYTSGGNACAIGDCRVDSDCGDGVYCSPSEYAGTLVCSGGGCSGSCGGRLLGYYCQAPSDEFTNDCDCYGDNYITAVSGFPGLEPICAWSSCEQSVDVPGLAPAAPGPARIPRATLFAWGTPPRSDRTGVGVAGISARGGVGGMVVGNPCGLSSPSLALQPDRGPGLPRFLALRPPHQPSKFLLPGHALAGPHRRHRRAGCSGAASGRDRRARLRLRAGYCRDPLESARVWASLTRSGDARSPVDARALVAHGLDGRDGLPGLGLGRRGDVRRLGAGDSRACMCSTPPAWPGLAGA